MKTLSIKVTNENGLTSRLAAELVAEANKHIARCTMVVDKDDPSQQADLKSIMNVFTLSIPKGGSFDIVIEGADEESAYMAFFHLLESLPLQTQTKNAPKGAFFVVLKYIYKFLLEIYSLFDLL